MLLFILWSKAFQASCTNVDDKKKVIFLSVTLKLCYIYRISLRCDLNLKSKTSLVKKYICTFMLVENNTVNSRDHQFEFYNFNNIILIIKKIKIT
jgi:hypothetical protein